MRRRSSLFALLALVLAVLGLAPLARAQDATPAAMAGHPLVGAWVLDTNADDPANAPGVATVAADGTFHEVDSDGSSGLGTWRPTGDRTAELVIVYPGEEGAFWIRVTLEVAADGRSFTASYTAELVGTDGAGTGQYGPATATGTRLEAETPGVPVGTLEDLFAQFGAGTPEAGTPAL